MAWQHRNRPANQTEPPALPALPHPLLLPPTLDSSAARLLSSLLFDSSLMTARPSLLPITESAIHSMAAIPARPNPRVAAGCADGSIHVCCGETGSRVWAAPGAHKGEVQSLVWLSWPDGPSAEERGDDDSDTATDEQKVMLNEDEAPVTPGDDDGEEKAEMVSSPGPRCSSSAGWLASSGPDNVARVWGAEGGAPLHSLWMPKADAGHSRSYTPPLQRSSSLCPLLFLLPPPLHPPLPPSLSLIVRPPRPPTILSRPLLLDVIPHPLLPPTSLPFLAWHCPSKAAYSTAASLCPYCLPRSANQPPQQPLLKQPHRVNLSLFWSLRRRSGQRQGLCGSGVGGRQPGPALRVAALLRSRRVSRPLGDPGDTRTASNRSRGSCSGSPHSMLRKAPKGTVLHRISPTLSRFLRCPEVAEWIDMPSSIRADSCQCFFHAHYLCARRSTAASSSASQRSLSRRASEATDRCSSFQQAWTGPAFPL